MNMNRISRALLMVMLSMALAVGMWGVMPAGKVVAATKTWDGGAGTMNWSDAANWNDDIAPTSADDVVLDNTYVSGSYTVNLPAIAISTTINKLTITPGSGNMITLVLPSGNTANPGLNVGDNTSGTDDIILNDGAVLKNSSGATAGTGVAVNSTTNGTLRINNGGRYIHNTGRGNSGIVARLSTAAGTETGIFEYDVPATSDYGISISGRTYGILMLSRSGATSFNYTATGSNPLTVYGNLVINANAAWTATGFTGGVMVAGDWINNGDFTVATNAVTFNGTTEQTIGGSTATGFYTLTVNSGATVVIPSTNIPTVSAAMVNNGTLKQTQVVTGSADVNFFNMGGYGGLTLNASGSDLGSTVVSIKGNQACDTDNTAVNRCFDITPTTAAGRNATLTFSYNSAELNSLDCATMNAWHWSGALPWVQAGTSGTRQCATDPYSLQVTGVTTFSPFALRSGAAGPTSVGSVALSGSASWLPIGMLLLAGLVVLRKRK